MSESSEKDQLCPLKEVAKYPVCVGLYSEAKECYHEAGEWKTCKYELDNFNQCILKETQKVEVENEHPPNLESSDD